PDTSMEAAVALAAHDTLVAMFPSQASRFDDLLAADLALIPDADSKNEGIDLGQRAAAAILARRSDDGSNHSEPRIGVDFFPSNQPGKWRPDPISANPLALGAYWNQVAPFTMQSAVQFRAQVPPALTSIAYTTAYNEVKSVGGD